MRILLLEDDPIIAFSIRRYFENAGHVVDSFATIEATADADPAAYDGVLLDINLPDGTGFDYLRYLRAAEVSVPVLILSVRDGEEDILRAFEAGADDYIAKPFSLAVLAARLRNIRRRAGEREQRLEWDGLKLLLAHKTAQRDGTVLDLNAAEYALLEKLLANRGICLLRSRLIDEIWGEEGRAVNDNTLTVTVKRLREKLGAYGRYIHTERGLGYCWEADDV